MIVHACCDGFIVEMDEKELNGFLRWWSHADLDDDDLDEE